MSRVVRGRPGRRVFEPSYFCATSRRYQRRMVSGVNDASDLREAAPAQDLAFHGQAASLVIGEARPSGTVRRAEDAVLLIELRKVAS